MLKENHIKKNKCVSTTQQHELLGVRDLKMFLLH